MTLNLTARVLLPYAFLGAVVMGALGTVGWVDGQRNQATQYTLMLSGVQTSAQAIAARVQTGILTADTTHAVAAAQLATETHRALTQHSAAQPGAAAVLTQFQAFYAGVVAVQSVYYEKRLEEGTRRMAQVLQMQTAIDTSIAAERARSQATQDRWQALAFSVMGGATVLILALGVLMAWLLRVSVVRPVQQVAHALTAIAGGAADLTANLPVGKVPEVAEIATAFNGVMARLRTQFLDVRSASDSIQTATAEITAGTLDLSQRTEETAAQTQNALNALRDMATELHQTDDAVKTATDLAREAAGVAQQGGAVVGQVVSTMDDINQSSKKISDIIGVIDGIAFQTNILALNAAVEAARAGEAGRGFAVVATEVRALAGRSAVASKEIKTLIDASVHRVTTGTQQVAQAGQTMNQVVEAVQRVSQTLQDIAVTSAHEARGIDRVAEAVGNVEQSTQQNAALVEESFAASQSLKDQTQRLGDIVGAFKLD